ncbi:SseB family protein [Kineococcus sp. G2]|uniref:SseB family protein n=1 Tax=Kineococcus sp. G2 TaxID=3127484 RepID=UPI00301CCB66
MPWAGRTLLPNPFTGDEGRRAPGLERALADWSAAGEGADAVAVLRAEARVVAQLAATRVFAPVVAVLGEQEVVAAGPAGDKSADMALALLTQPDGRRGLPLFTDLAALSAWRPDARPVPVPAARAALSGVQERCEVLVLDPAGPVRFVVRRTALWALAQEREWVPAPFDGLVEAAVTEAAAGVEGVRGVRLEAAPGGELRVVVGVVPGLDGAGLQRLTARLGERLGASPVVADRVDSLDLRLLPAP